MGYKKVNYKNLVKVDTKDLVTSIDNMTVS